MIQKKQQELMSSLRGAAKIEMLDPKLKATPLLPGAADTNDAEGEGGQ